MTDTTTIQTEKPPEPAALPDMPTDPSDILMYLIVAFLAPMFLGASAGDIGFARLAAIETVNAYRARDHADLLSIAQIIGFSLTALGSLSLSMADNISLSMTLRLRGNAVSLNRAAEHSRRALAKNRIGDPMPRQATTMEQPGTFPPARAAEDQNHATLLAGVAAARTLAVETQAPIRAAKPAAELAAAPTPAPIAASTTPTTAHAITAPSTTKQQNQAAWATAMADAAAKLTACIANLPPAERKAASLRAAALASTANNLLSGNRSEPIPSLTAIPSGNHETGHPHPPPAHEIAGRQGLQVQRQPARAAVNQRKTGARPIRQPTPIFIVTPNPPAPPCDAAPPAHGSKRPHRCHQAPSFGRSPRL